MSSKYIPWNRPNEPDYPYTVHHKVLTANGWLWIKDFSFDNLDEARKEAEYYSRNNYESQISDLDYHTIAYYKDMQEVTL